MQSPRILLIDDEPDIRDIMSEALEYQGYKTAACASGEEGLEYLRAQSEPDLILLDMTMPRMSGAEFRQRLLQEPRFARIPVVLMSASGDLSRAASKLQVSGHLAKPMNIGGLLQAIEKFLPRPA